MMKAKPRGVYKRRVFYSEDALGSVDVSVDKDVAIRHVHLAM
jgi:hypothetical protein